MMIRLSHKPAAHAGDMGRGSLYYTQFHGQTNAWVFNAAGLDAMAADSPVFLLGAFQTGIQVHGHIRGRFHDHEIHLF